MIIFKKDEVMKVGKELEQLECTWEGSHIKNLISVDIPKHLSYSIIKEYLDKGEKEERWTYKEACIKRL